MTWVKRGGGRGTGIYGVGLPAADNPANRQGSPAPSAASSTGDTDTRREPGRESSEPALAPAYRVTQWSQVRNNKIMLDLLANLVATVGCEPEMSMYYESALAEFGADSPHFIGACQGQAGAGSHYQRTVAGGYFRDGG